jgi:hypothetical protein
MSWIENLIELKENNKIGFIKSQINFEESWEDFLHYRKEANAGRSTRWENNNLSIAFETIGSPLMKKFNSFNILRNGLYEIWGDLVWDEPAIIMSDTLGPTSGLREHKDNCSQIHLNCIGSTEWRIKKSDGFIIKQILNPGDIVYLPTGTLHEVTTISAPRVGIAYSIKNEYI